MADRPKKIHADKEGDRPWIVKEKSLSRQIALGRERVHQVLYTRRDLASIAGLTASLKVDGHRADLVTLRGAQAHAAFQGRHQITDEDIVLAAELALPHRIKSRPLQEAAINVFELEERLEEAQGDWEKNESGEQVDDQGDASESKKKV